MAVETFLYSSKTRAMRNKAKSRIQAIERMDENRLPSITMQYKLKYRRRIGHLHDRSIGPETGRRT